MRWAACSAGLAGAGLWVAACAGGGTPNGSAMVQGTIQGSVIDVADAYGTNRTFASMSDEVTTVNVSITSLPGICGDVLSGKRPPNLRVLGISLTVSGAPPQPATYDIAGTDPAMLLAANYQATDANCMASRPDTATAGTVTFTTLDTGNLSGSFDLTFSDGHVTGQFTAPVCNPNEGMATHCGS